MTADPKRTRPDSDAPECLLLSDGDGQIRWASPTVERVLGRAADEVTTTETVASLFQSPSADPLAPGTGRTTFDAIVRVPGGGAREVTVTVTPVDDERPFRLFRCRTTDDEGLRLATVLSRVADGIVSLDTDWRYTSVNESAEELLGRSAEELLGEVVWDAFPAARAELQPAFEEAMATRDPVVTEWYGPSFGRWIEIHGYPSETGMSVYFRDITERKEREESLRQERDLTDQLFRASPVGICVLTPGGQFVRVNERAEELLGVDGPEMLDESFREPTWEVRGPDGGELDDDEFPFTIALTTGEPTFGHEQTLLRADGTRIWVSVSAAPVLDEAGTVDRVVVTFEDISEQKTAEQRLQASEQQFRAVFDGTLDALVLADDDGDYLEVNEAACDLYGLAESDLLGKNAADFAPEEYDVAAAWEAFIEQGALRGEFPLVRPDGEVRITDFAATANVRPGLHLSALRDITDRTETQARLEAQRDELGRVNRINELIREVNQAVITATDREVIEAAVCDALVAAESYPIALTFRTTAEETVRAKHVAGLDKSKVEELEYIGDETLETAIREAETTNRPTVVSGLQTDGRHSEAFRETAAVHDIEAVGNVPIECDGVVYGVLMIAANSEDALGERELSVFVELGQLLGTAINAIQTKKLLYATAVTELELAVTGTGAPLIHLNERVGGTWTVDSVVPVEAHRYLLYVDVDGADPAEIEGVASSIDGIEAIRLIERGESRTLEIRVSGTSPISTIFDAGGWIRTATFENGTARFFVDLTLDADVRSFIGRIRQRGVDVELLSKREVDRTAPGAWGDTDGDTDLTERQRTVLEAAFRSGYFDWPRRRTTGEELADALDLSSSTLHQHLRVASAKVLERYFALEPISRE